MEIKIVKTKDFYPTMKYWWDGHEFKHASPSMLPDTTFVVLNNEGVPVYSTCFYNTDSNLCWIGWQISNPYVEKTAKEGCFELLTKVIGEYAKGLGYQILFTTSSTPPVEQNLLDNDFVKGDTNVNHYIKNL